MPAWVKPTAAGLALAGAFAAGWVTQGWRADAAAARVEAKQSRQDVAQSQQSQAATEEKAGALLQHAGEQQENTHEYTKTMVLLDGRSAADAALIAGLQRDLRTTSTRAAQAASDAAACRSLADRHERLAALVGEGAGVVIEARQLVERRDAAVMLLRGQIEADGRLLGRDTSP